MTLKEKLGLSQQPLFLMDGTAFIYRSFYANRHLRRSDGFPTNALSLVTRVLLKILRQESPHWFLFAMDGKGKNFRNDIYPQYKANREAMPEELAAQIEPVKRMVDALGLKREVARDFEADDCIASLAARFSPELPVIIVSGDKDLKQCLGPRVFMWDPGAKEEKLITEADFIAENGVTPARWPDVQALMGDSSDNIPGVPGIGPKTALQIFEKCDSLEDIRDHLDRLPEKIQSKLKPHLEEMFIWRELTTLRLDRCENLSLEALAVQEIRLGECDDIAAEFELFALRREIGALARESHANPGPALSPEAPAEIEAATQAVTESWPPAERLESAEDLLSCSGKTVAVIWPEWPRGAPHLAISQDVSSSPAGSCGNFQEFEWAGSLAQLCQWLEPCAEIVVADLKAALVRLPSWRKMAEAEAAPSFFDLGLAAYLLDPEDTDYSWRRLAARWREPLQCGAKGPAALALALRGTLAANLGANSLRDLYDKIEMPLISVLARMELTGVAIDPPAFQSFLRDVQGELDKLTELVYAEAGMSFNIRSSRQLGEVLFEKLRLASPRRTKSGQISTSQAALEKLEGEYPIVDNILRFRKLDKMRSTYLDPLPRLMDRENRLHTTFNQEATATGRISSSDPNLQNIPVRGPLGKRMRTCFVPASGNSLVAADYSQIELRILADLSGDANLLEAFHNGEDIHARTAALIFDLSPGQVGAEQRRMAKTINFGLLYGMGAQKLARELKIGTAQAKDFIGRYFARLSGLEKFYAEIIEGARKDGYVTTMAGRRRWLPGIFSANGQLAAQAQRQAVNTVIQGSAADVIKMAMLGVAHDRQLLANGARLVLQVHDELLLEAPEQNAETVARRVAELMESVSPGGRALRVPLVVDWGVGANWGKAH